MDPVVLRGLPDGERVIKRDGEGFLHHGGDVVLRRCFHHAAVILDGGVDKDCVGLLFIEHRLEVGVGGRGLEVVLLLVLLCERDIWLDDGNKLRIGGLGQRTEKALDVAVDETHDGDANGCGFLGGRGGGCREDAGDEEQTGKDR